MAKRHSTKKQARHLVKKLSLDQFRIVGISLLVIVGIIALVLVRPLFVGKAVETGEGNKVDLRYENGQLLLEVTSVPSANGISFNLLSDAISCGSLSFSSELNWEYRELSCDTTVNPHKYTYGIASTVKSQSGTFTVVTLTPASTLPDSFSVSLENIDVFSGSTDSFPAGAESGTFAFTTAPSTQAPAPVVAPSSDGGSSSGG